MSNETHIRSDAANKTLRAPEMQGIPETTLVFPDNIIRFCMTALAVPEPISHSKRDRPVVTREMMAEMDCPFPPEPDLVG